jgi:hypothetical protein
MVAQFLALGNRTNEAARKFNVSTGRISQRRRCKCQSKSVALPPQPFEARRVEICQANSLSLVRFDRNDYSVPTQHAHHAVWEG